MNILNLTLIFLVIIGIGFTMGFPEATFEGPIYELTRIEDVEGPELTMRSEEAPIRHRRVTCDLLSARTPWVTVNHSACAIRCLAQRRRGGRCQDGICVCR